MQPTPADHWGMAFAHYSGHAKRAKLVDLPDELLLAILENVAEPDCVALSLTSKRLHVVALSFVFSKCGIVDHPSLSSGKFVIRASARRALRYLRLALFITSVKQLTVELVHDGSNLQEFASFVSNPSFSHVEEVTLDCTDVRFYRNRGRDRRLLNCPYPWTIVWNQAFRQITASLDQRSCTSLKILGGHMFAGRTCSDDDDILELNRWTLSKFRSIIPLSPLTRHKFYGWLTGLNSSSSSSTASHCDLVPISTLKFFDIRSSLIIREPFLRWTILTINISPITRLCLCLHISAMAWRELLSWLHVPMLSDLSISHFTSVAADVKSFISRHPTITTLDLCDNAFCLCDGEPVVINLSSLVPPTSSRKEKLPRLSVLRATPEYMAYLFSIQPPSRIFPNLVSITLEPFIHPPSKDFGFGPLDVALFMLSTGCKSSQQIALTLRLCSQNDNFTNWLESIISHEENVRHFPHNLERATYWDSMHCVRKLCIQTLDDAPFRQPVAKLIPRWISMLPALQNLAFSEACLNWMGARERRDFNAEIMALCPSIRKVETTA
jgi:hypothetical protein